MSKIILGYVIFNLYIVFVLLLGILLEKKTRLNLFMTSLTKTK